MASAFVQLAQAGELDALAAAVRAQRGDKVDRALYKWLRVAADLGHEDAFDLISDLLEHSSLRYDDSGLEQAAAHWELALDYLRGAEALPADLQRAEAHLDEAFRHRPGRDVLDEINAATQERHSVAAVLPDLTGAARALLERKLAGDAVGRVRHLLARVERLQQVCAPESILAHERELLRAAMATLPAAIDDDGLRERLRKAAREGSNGSEGG